MTSRTGRLTQEATQSFNITKGKVLATLVNKYYIGIYLNNVHIASYEKTGREASSISLFALISRTWEQYSDLGLVKHCNDLTTITNYKSFAKTKAFRILTQMKEA